MFVYYVRSVTGIQSKHAVTPITVQYHYPTFHQYCHQYHAFLWPLQVAEVLVTFLVRLKLAEPKDRFQRYVRREISTTVHETAAWLAQLDGYCRGGGRGFEAWLDQITEEKVLASL